MRAIPMAIALAMMVKIIVTEAIWGTIGAHWAVEFRITFRIKRFFVTISVDFAIRINRAVPIPMTGNIWSGSRSSRTNVNQATLDREARKDE